MEWDERSSQNDVSPTQPDDSPTTLRLAKAGFPPLVLAVSYLSEVVLAAACAVEVSGLLVSSSFEHVFGHSGPHRRLEDPRRSRGSGVPC